MVKKVTEKMVTFLFARRLPVINMLFGKWLLAPFLTSVILS